MSSNFITQIKY